MFYKHPFVSIDTIKHIFLGDFNCKSHWWGYTSTDPVGRAVQSVVQNGDVRFLNMKGVNTLRQGTIPDLSLATHDIADQCSWSTGHYLGSDHKTILITLNFNKSRMINRMADRIVPVHRAQIRRKHRSRFTVAEMLKFMRSCLSWLYKLLHKNRRNRQRRARYQKIT